MSTKKLIKDFGLQGIVDFVESYPTRKEGCKQLGLPLSGFEKILYVINHLDSKKISSIESGKLSLTKAHDDCRGYIFFKTNSLDILSKKAKESIGEMSDKAAHVVKWGLVDMESFINHYMKTGYGKQTQAAALTAHYWLMYEGYESNYLQMLGVTRAYEDIIAVNGKFTERDRDRLKKGVFCPQRKTNGIDKN